MMETKIVDGKLMASVTGQLEGADLDRLLDVEILEFKPEAADFQLDAPLHLPNLQMLNIASSRQPILEVIGSTSLMGLRYLVVVDGSIALEGIRKLGILPKLEHLFIRHQRLNDESVDWICRQKRIKELALTDTNFSDSMVAKLDCKNFLRKLDLFRSVVSFSDRQIFGEKFPFVRSLDVAETGVSGKSIETIQWLFPQLERFLAEKNQLSDADVRKLATWTKLKVLQTNTPDVDFDFHGQIIWDL